MYYFQIAHTDLLIFMLLADFLKYLQIGLSLSLDYITIVIYSDIVNILSVKLNIEVSGSSGGYQMSSTPQCVFSRHVFPG